MYENNRLAKTAYIRITIIVFMLLVWIAGISLSISSLSPISELIKSSPVTVTDEVKEKLVKLEAQSAVIRDAELKADSLYKAYSIGTIRLKEKIIELPQDAKGLLSFIELVKSEAYNPNIGQYSSKILEIRVDWDYSRSEEKLYFPKAIKLFIGKPDIVIKEEKNGQDIPYYSIQSSKQILDKNIAVNKELNLKDYYTFVDFEIGSGQAHNSTDNIGIDLLTRVWMHNKDSAELFDYNYKLYLVPRDGPAVKNYYDSIIIGLENNLSSIRATHLKYSKLLEKVEKAAAELESRTLSSTPLFIVVAFRASLIVLVMVAIGFILIKALSAELNQMRRLSYVQVTNNLLASHNENKIQYAPYILRAVCGDISKNKEQADLPLLARAVDKAGEYFGNQVTSSRSK